VDSFPTEVGGFKPDFWKMNRTEPTVFTHYRPAAPHDVARAAKPEHAGENTTSGLKITEVSTPPIP
jgi:hypothetical protein